ncbi:MAG: RICIN domain-containing protein [Bacilli bacterium]|nr:RICIN domain-containing protein [Bacilli bacterium]
MKKYFILIFVFILIFFITIDVEAKEVKSGTYKIVSANDESKLLVEQNGNIELGDNSSSNKEWNIYSDGSAYYIKSKIDNNYVIDLQGAKIANNTNVQVYKSNGTSAQKWKLNDAGSGYYYITSILGNYNIDVVGGNSKIGTNIQIYKNNETKAQKWKLVRIDQKEKVIEDGTYIVKCKNNLSNVVDLSGAKTSNFTNIGTYFNNYTWAQVWNFKYKDGYYIINAYLDDDKVIDIASAKYKNSTNIQLYQNNGTNAQKFIINSNGDGTYSINSYDGLWSVDIKGASTNSGTNIQLYQSNGTDAQKYVFEKVNIDPIETGYYTIDSLVDNNMVVGVNNSALYNKKNVDLRNKTNHNYVKWYIKKEKYDIYTILNADNTKYALDVLGGSNVSGANVQVYKANGTSAQKWVIRKNDDNTYRIINIASGKLLDISGAKKDEGTNIQIYDSNETVAQKFEFTKTEISKYIRAYDDGKYIIKSNIDNNKVLDIASASKNNNANVQVYASNSTNAQVWKLEYIEDGIYIIRSLINPKLVLTANSNNAVSAKYTGSDTQKWYLDKNSNFTTIINMSSGKYLNIDSTMPANSTNVSLSDTITDKNKFVLSSFTGKIKYKGVDISKHNTITSWEQLASQIDFAVLRIGYGGDATSQDDPKFLSYVQACEQYNIPYAVYVYSYAVDDSEAVDESNHMLRQIRNNGAKPNLATQVYYDQEDTTYVDQTKISNATRTSMVNTFCNRMKSSGYKCGVYASKSWLEGMLDINAIKPTHEVWVAQWPGYSTFTQGLANSTSYQKTSYSIWQFSGSGNLSGVSGRIDLDIGYNIFD